MVIDFQGEKRIKKKWFTRQITLISGNIDADTVFTYDINTEVYYSCAATLHGELWVIGGRYKKQQVILIKKIYY